MKNEIWPREKVQKISVTRIRPRKEAKLCEEPGLMVGGSEFLSLVQQKNVLRTKTNMYSIGNYLFHAPELANKWSEECNYGRRVN